MTNLTFIEQHYAFGVGEFEGLWPMTLKHPFNREEHISILVQGPNSNPDNTPAGDRKIVEAGPRLTEVLKQLLYKIEAYPYSWDFSGKKIVSYGYDFESDFSGENLTFIDLTEIAFKEVVEHFNFFSPLQQDTVDENEKVSGKGVMAKMKITLDKPKTVNHLALDFFAEYPMELISVMYQKDQSKEAARYEIPLQKVVETNGSTYLHFTPVFAKVFYIIIKQESYTLLADHKTEAQVDKENLWDLASERSRSLYENTVGDYMGELFSSASSVQLHQEILDSYQHLNRPIDSPQNGSMNPYRAEFKEAKKQLDSQQR